MSGALVQVIPARNLDFSKVSGGTSMTMVLERAIDVRAWYWAALLVRVSSATVVNGNIQLAAFREGPSTDDPGNQFVESLPIMSHTIDSTSAAKAPYFVVASLFTSV